MSREGWHRALDVQMDSHKWCMSRYGSAYNIHIFESFLQGRTIVEDDPTYVQLAASLTVALWGADTIFVTSDMLHVMLQAAHELPDHVEFDKHTLITSNGFCLFEEPLSGQDINGKTMLIHALAWTMEKIAAEDPSEEPRDCIMLYFLVDPTDMNDDVNREYIKTLRELDIPVPPLALTHFYPALVGMTPPAGDKPGMTLVKETCRLFLAMQLLAQQRLGEVRPVNPDRATRKRYARDWGPNAPERIISLITLRRKKGKANQDPSPVPWSRRWIVKGFWRRQWYPSLKKHDWIYISEFVKGPEDKPLIITERRVFNFKR